MAIIGSHMLLYTTEPEALRAVYGGATCSGSNTSMPAMAG